MHDSPLHGVVDRNCRIHGMSNLYVAGSSVFPTAGANFPTITLAALALRLSGHLALEADKFGRDTQPGLGIAREPDDFSMMPEERDEPAIAAKNPHPDMHRHDVHSPLGSGLDDQRWNPMPGL
jgi:hypothetical protein